MELILLGTGTRGINPKHAGSAVAVTTGDILLLVDSPRPMLVHRLSKSS